VRAQDVYVIAFQSKPIHFFGICFGMRKQLQGGTGGLAIFQYIYSCISDDDHVWLVLHQTQSFA
jgi:hypothetical protein